MRVGIIGVGMVGETLKYGFERIGHDVFCYDPAKGFHNLLGVLTTELIFICVPTPSTDTGSCDTSIVEDVVRDIEHKGYKGLVVIKSTVTPGTTDRLINELDLSIVFCPEFLKEKSRFVDFVENHDVCIIGAYEDEDYELVKEAHGSLPKQFVRLSPGEAEMAKYFSNTFNALRIVFANQFYDICDVLGYDYTAIKNAVVKRKSISDHYLECNKNFREFGGNCLPKDTRAFLKFAEKIGADTTLWEDIVFLNMNTEGERDEEASAA